MKHRKITPLWPAAKAQVEWFNKPLKIIKPGKDHPNFKCGGELVSLQLQADLSVSFRNGKNR